jgi:hypothetical protein
MPTESFRPEDISLLESLREGGGWLRGVLITLARRGVTLRRESPERAQAILDALTTFPYYKGGQFLFDLLELEDFMLNGPAPALMPNVLDASALQRIAGALNAVRQSIDGSPVEEPLRGITVEGGGVGETLEALEPGFYLYQDVVLGIWRTLT